MVGGWGGGGGGGRVKRRRVFTVDYCYSHPLPPLPPVYLLAPNLVPKEFNGVGDLGGGGVWEGLFKLGVLQVPKQDYYIYIDLTVRFTRLLITKTNVCLCVTALATKR